MYYTCMIEQKSSFTYFYQNVTVSMLTARTGQDQSYLSYWHSYTAPHVQGLRSQVLIYHHEKNSKKESSFNPAWIGKIFQDLFNKENKIHNNWKKKKKRKKREKKKETIDRENEAFPHAEQIPRQQSMNPVLDTRLQLLAGTQLQRQPWSKLDNWFLGRPTLAKCCKYIRM